MNFAAGDVVVLKSGGQAMTVVAASDDDVDCVWIGEDGELFRETLPSVALLSARLIDHDEEEDDDEAHEGRKSA